MSLDYKELMTSGENSSNIVIPLWLFLIPSEMTKKSHSGDFGLLAFKNSSHIGTTEKAPWVLSSK